MDRLLGHLAQFASLSQQGELLCTQGLAYLLRDTGGERAFRAFITSATGQPVSAGLSWHAESRQEDRGRPDLEGRNEDGQPVVKIEAKLWAPFGQGQLDSYVSALCVGGQGGTFLILVPRSRLQDITDHVSAHFAVPGAAPWRLPREAAEIACAVFAWEDLMDALSEVDSERFQNDLGQFRAMYRVFNDDEVEPPTSDEEILAWHEREAWWDILVDRVTRALNSREGRILPFGVDGGAQRYRRRYICRRISGESSCYSVGTRDPFQGHRTPVWLRFHRGTGHYAEIVMRLGRSELAAKAIHSQGHTWFPLDVPQESDRRAIIGALVTQVQGILAIAYPPQVPTEPQAAQEAIS